MLQMKKVIAAVIMNFKVSIVCVTGHCSLFQERPASFSHSTASMCDHSVFGRGLAIH